MEVLQADEAGQLQVTPLHILLDTPGIFPAIFAASKTGRLLRSPADISSCFCGIKLGVLQGDLGIFQASFCGTKTRCLSKETCGRDDVFLTLTK